MHLVFIKISTNFNCRTPDMYPSEAVPTNIYIAFEIMALCTIVLKIGHI